MHRQTGKTVFIAGGSRGLGLEIAKQLAAQGANITIFARNPQQLGIARDEILAARVQESQEVHAVALDLTDASQIEEIFRSQKNVPDSLYCVAGGTSNETGFIIDITSNDLDRCMRNNYLTSAFPAQTVLKMWIEGDRKSQINNAKLSSPKPRQLIFVSSAAAFVGLPGYTAYTPTKCAVRALADTLRAEVLRYSGPASKYSVHCAFPSNFISPAFIDEQKAKPELTKQMEGTAAPISELEKKLHSSEQVARYIITAVGRGEFAICSELEAAALFTNMTGPSPMRGLGVMDSLLSLVVKFIGWPILRRQLDAMCVKDGKTAMGSPS